jgi:type II secretory pathway component PulF
MLGSGIPILEAVDTLLEENKGPTRRVLMLFRTALNEGRPLSYAMQKAPKVFDPVTINLLQAAEIAGTLEEALHDLSLSIKKDMAFNDKIRSSLLYPGFIMGIFVLVLVVILVFVVPRISKIFLGLRVELPLPTLFMIRLSDFVVNNYLYILAGLAAAVVLLIWLFRTQRRAILNMFLNLPLLKRLGRLIDLTRFTRSMGQLLKAGVPVAEALEFSSKVVTKREIASIIELMYKSVSAGSPLSEGLKGSSHVIPPMVLHIMQTAERSGTLEKSLQELSEYCESQVSHTLKNVTTLIEPILIVVIGLLVGGMMLAIIAPIYNIIGQINR